MKSGPGRAKPSAHWRCLLAVVLCLAAPACGRAGENAARPGGFEPVDLTRFQTLSFLEHTNQRPWNRLPLGRQLLDGVPFLLTGKIEVTGLDAARHGQFVPPRVLGITVGRKAARLVLLHGAAHGYKDGAPLARLVLHYAGGETHRFRIAYGVHVRNWIRFPYEYRAVPADPNSSIAWTLTNDEGQVTHRLFKTIFDNPRPEQEIVSIDFESLLGKATPILFALTLDPEGLTRLSPPTLPRPKAVARAAGWDDADCVQEIVIRGRDAESRSPLTNAVASLMVFDGTASFFFGEARADAQGRMALLYPPQQTLELQLQIAAPGRVPETLVLSTRPGAWAPGGENVVALRRGVTAGGWVRSLSGQPVEGAEVFLQQRVKTGPAEFTQTSFGSVLTGRDGHWSSSNLPMNFDGFSFAVTHPDYTGATFAQSAEGSSAVGITRESLLAGGAVMGLQPRIRVTGVVTDARGRAVTNAEVFFRLAEEERRRTATDATGRFSILVTRMGQAALAVSAGGFAPHYETFPCVQDLRPFKIELGRGAPFKLRVHDTDGVPVAGAQVSLEWWNATRLVSWRALADAQGRCVWTNAPLGGLAFSINKDEFSSTRVAVGAPAKSEVMVTLKRPFRSSGTVADATTKEPLGVFDVTRGHRDFPDEPIRWDRGNTTRARRGRYSLGLGEFTGGETFVLIEAPGYLPVRSEPIRVSGSHTNQFELTRGGGISGVVEGPGGVRAKGAAIVLVGAGDDVRLESPGELRRPGGTGAATVTDKQGRFELRPGLEANTIVASHSLGFARVRAADVAAAGRIILQPWGRVKGSLAPGVKPPPNQAVAIHSFEHNAASDGLASVSFLLRTRPDAKGNFVFEKVPSGEAKVSILHRLADASSGPAALSHDVPVVVTSGETNEVSFPQGGRSLTGRVQITSGHSGDVNWLRDVHTLKLCVPDAPIFQATVVGAKSEAERQKLDHELRARERAFWTSEKGRAVERAQRTYLLLFDTNGTFRVDNVPAGTYQLTLAPSDPTQERSTHPPLATLTQRIVVRSGKSGEALDLGPLKFALPPVLRLGETAPALPARTFDGAALDLARFRGKFVLLDFWVVSNSSRLNELEQLKVLSEEPAAAERLVIVSLNLDRDARIGAAFAAGADAPWPQGHLAASGSASVLASYGLDGAGACVLIDPEGRAVSKGFRADYARSQVRRILTPSRE